MNFANAAFRQNLERMRGDVGPAQFVGGFGQDARHVERHIAVADHRRGLAAEIELAVAVVRMAVIPGDEVAGVMAPRQVFAGDAQRPADVGAGRKHHRVIAFPQLVDGDIASDRDAADETKPRRCCDPVEGRRDQLELGVVGSDAEPDQSVRHRQPLEHVDG